MTFDEMRKLKYGWDGEDAEPVSEKAIATAKEFLERMEFTPDVNGGIDIEFELPGVTPMGRHLYITIDKRGGWICSYLKVDGKQVSSIDRFVSGEQKAGK